MATTDEERFLRSSFLLLKGTLYIAKKVLLREEDKEIKLTGRNLDSLLNTKKEKLQHEFRHCKQKQKLFPQYGQTNVDDWDISLLTGVLLIVFRPSLTDVEIKAVRTIKHQRNDVYAHRATASLDSDTYTDICNDLTHAFDTLALGFGPAIKQECNDIVQTCLNGNLDIKSQLEQLKRNSEADHMLCKIIVKIEASLKEATSDLTDVLKEEHSFLRRDINENISRNTDIVCNTIRDSQITKEEMKAALLEALQQIRQGRPCTRKVKVVDSQLEVNGNDEDRTNIDLAEHILVTVTNEAIRRAETSEENIHIRKFIQEILDEITSHSDVKPIAAEMGCVIIRFDCYTYQQLFRLITYMDSDDMKERLNQLATSLSRHLNTKEKLNVTFSLSLKTLQSIIDEIGTNVQRKYKKSVRIPVQIDSLEGVNWVMDLFERGGLTDKLDTLSEALTKKVGAKVNVTSYVNMNHFIDALHDFGDEEKPAMQIEKSEGHEGANVTDIVVSSEVEDEDSNDFGIRTEIDFVGREKDLCSLQKAWKSHKMFGIFGLRSVGKSRLVEEFLNRKKTQDFAVIKIDLRLQTDKSSLYAVICAELRLEPKKQSIETDRWIYHIYESLARQIGMQFIFVFDNTEDFQESKGENIRDSFLSLCTVLVRKCINVKVFITSTTRVHISQLRKVYFAHEVLPLNRAETSQLLKSVTPGIDLGEYTDALVTLTEGLPLLILMVGSELAEDDGMITPKDMVEFLLEYRLRSLSREFYPEEDRVSDVYKKFIDRLNTVYKRRLTILEYIPGTFNADQARQILDFKSEATVKDQALIPIRRRHILNYDPNTRRFSIQGILRECIKVFYTIKNLPEIRARYCQIFSTVMKNISEKLGTVEYAKALAEFTLEQPNLQKLLTEVRYTRQDSYRFFIEMATKCTNLIEQYMAGDSEDFYQGCLRAADMYGQDDDKAVVNLAVGSMYTNTKGYLSKGAEMYKSALSVLETKGKTLQLATAYQRIGWNMLQQGNMLEASGYFKKSLGISLFSGEEYQLIVLQSMSSMGVCLTQLGRFEDSERYHLACLKRRLKIQGEDHPAVGASLNNLGVMYDQKGDSENALKYYQKGLEVKLKSNAPVTSIVFSLSNAANMSMAMGNCEEAHRLLDDALHRLYAEKVPPREALACTYDTKGKVYLKEEKLKEAEEMFQKAVDIREDISDNLPYLESLVHLADVNKRRGQYDQSLHVAKQALRLKKKATTAMPQNSFIAECYRCLADVYRKTSDTEKYKETLEKIEAELLRLEQVFLCQCNENSLHKVRSQLNDINDKLDKMKS